MHSGSSSKGSCQPSISVTPGNPDTQPKLLHIHQSITSHKESKQFWALNYEEEGGDLSLHPDLPSCQEVTKEANSGGYGPQGPASLMTPPHWLGHDSVLLIARITAEGQSGQRVEPTGSRNVSSGDTVLGV